MTAETEGYTVLLKREAKTDQSGRHRFDSMRGV
jgi:hypothetical protein